MHCDKSQKSIGNDSNFVSTPIMSQGQECSRTSVAIFRSSPSSRLKQESLGTEDLGADQFSEPPKLIKTDGLK